MHHSLTAQILDTVMNRLNKIYAGEIPVTNPFVGAFLWETTAHFNDGVSVDVRLVSAGLNVKPTLETVLYWNDSEDVIQREVLSSRACIQGTYAWQRGPVDYTFTISRVNVQGNEV
jgi:hypothetical protein